MSESTEPLLGPPQVNPQAYVSHLGHGSIGPVIGVLTVIAILGTIAVIIGRLCSGRRVMGRVQYDLEGWAETKCASCIDGRIDPPPLPRHPAPPTPAVEPPEESNSSEEEAEPELGQERREEMNRPRENNSTEHGSSSNATHQQDS